MAKDTTGLITPTFDRSRQTILIVDDNPATRYSTTRVIRAAGFQTLEAETGERAIQLAEEGVAALVLDVHLPDMSGFDVCRTLRATRPTSLIPIVHLSAAFIESTHQVAGLNAGADAYMVHPVEPQLLVATLQALIRARLAEDGLRRSESRFRAIYDQAPAAMMLIDAAGHITDANPQAQVLLQRPHADLLGEKLISFTPPAWADMTAQQLARSVEEAWEGEFPVYHADGRERMIAWSFSAPIEPGIQLAIAQDLTEAIQFEKQREEVLEREQAARAMAERHSRTKDDFVAILSHELRTPLTVLSGWAHILKRPNLSAEMLGKGIDAIEKGVKAQSRIISDILDISRLAAGKLNLHREWSDIDALTLQSIDALRDVAAARRIDIRYEQSGSTESTWIDVTRYQQIVWNLLTNAIKFSEAGASVHVTLERDGDALTLRVRDEGQGIPADFLPHVFERFSQAGVPNTRGHGGLGLGLSIVKHLAELHGGTVAASSKGTGHGTTMTVRLQIGHGEPSPSTPADTEESGTNLVGKDILVVEDNPDTSDMLRVVLSDHGANVRLADRYEQAIERLDERWPDLLVSDIGLPGRDGYQLIQTVREMERQRENALPLRAIALSAFAREQDRNRAIASGFNVHLPKPLQPHQLIRALREY